MRQGLEMGIDMALSMWRRGQPIRGQPTLGRSVFDVVAVRVFLPGGSCMPAVGNHLGHRTQPWIVSQRPRVQMSSVPAERRDMH
jgi:hypothetical protein